MIITELFIIRKLEMILYLIIAVLVMNFEYREQDIIINIIICVICEKFNDFTNLLCRSCIHNINFIN